MSEQELSSVLNDAIDRLAAGDSVDVITADAGRYAADLRSMLEAGLLTRRIHYPAAEVSESMARIDSQVLPNLSAPGGSFSSPNWVILPVLIGLGVLAAVLLRDDSEALPTVPSTGIVTQTAESATSTVVTATVEAISTAVPSVNPVPSIEAVAYPIQLSGALTQSDEGFVISGLPIEFASPPNLEPGTVVSISGVVQAGHVIAETIVTVTPASASPLPSETAASTTASASPTALAGTPIRLVIQGPVEQIEGNIITILEQRIEIEPQHPLLTTIQVGDVLRLDGHIDVAGRWVIVTIVFVSVDVILSPEGLVWRDSGTCADAPPEWARPAATRWLGRCASNGGGNTGGASGGGNSGGGTGGGDNDDDD